MGALACRINHRNQRTVSNIQGSHHGISSAIQNRFLVNADNGSYRQIGIHQG